MTELGVFLGGEGPNELGSYTGHPAYFDERQPGVIAALLRRVEPSGWRVVGAMKWAEIRKYRAYGPSPNEARNVRALILRAQDAKADVLAFTRDSDGDQTRVRDIEEAIAEYDASGRKPKLIGGVAIPLLEAWLLALDGEFGTEQLSKKGAQDRFENKHHFAKVTEKVVAYVERADLNRIPSDALRLARWIASARAILPVDVPGPSTD